MLLSCYLYSSLWKFRYKYMRFGKPTKYELFAALPLTTCRYTMPVLFLEMAVAKKTIANSMDSLTILVAWATELTSATFHLKYGTLQKPLHFTREASRVVLYASWVWGSARYSISFPQVNSLWAHSMRSLMRSLLNSPHEHLQCFAWWLAACRAETQVGLYSTE